LEQDEPTVAELVGALCTRMGEPGGPLAEDQNAQVAAERVVEAVHGGAGEAELRALFAQLDAALREAGLGNGLGAGGFRTESPGRYQRLPGMQGRAVHKVLACPAADRCARLERPTWTTRTNPPVCALHGLPLQERRLM
jgi:hypothetical protein